MPYNPGNVRRLNALGGKRPQARYCHYQKMVIEMY